MSVKALVVRPEKHTVEEVEINDFKDIQEAIHAHVFDVCSRQIGMDSSKVYDIYVDDMGLLRDDPQVSAWGPTDDSTLVGEILISLTDYNGYMVSLTQTDIDYIRSHCHTVINIEGGEEVTALFPVFYPTIYE